MIPHRAFALAIFSLLAAGCAAGATSRVPTDDLLHFRYAGKPIPPGCLLKFVDYLADPYPTVAGVDVEGFIRSNGNSGQVTEKNGSVEWTGNEALDGGSLDYRFVGRTSKGSYVLVTSLNTGGSGLFCDVVVVGISIDRVYEFGKWRNRTLLTLRGIFALGGRDDGAVEVRDGHVVIGKSKNRPTETILPIE